MALKAATWAETAEVWYSSPFPGPPQVYAVELSLHLVEHIEVGRTATLLSLSPHRHTTR